jgi:hypothetical protein
MSETAFPLSLHEQYLPTSQVGTETLNCLASLDLPAIVVVSLRTVASIFYTKQPRLLLIEAALS